MISKKQQFCSFFYHLHDHSSRIVPHSSSPTPWFYWMSKIAQSRASLLETSCLEP